MKNVLTPKQLAEAIGVSESSLKRWADDGRLPVSRTAGGHRRIRLNDAVRFIRETASPLVRPEILGLADVVTLERDEGRGEADTDRLLRYLQAGQAAQARGLILSLYMRGEPVASICDGPIHQSMQVLGELWVDHADGVFIEHRATDICLQAINQLRLLLELPASAPRAVGGAPEGDPYLLPSMAAATVLRSIGVDADNLGPDAPAVALAQAAGQVQASVIWVSVSTRDGRAEPEEHLRTLLDLTESRPMTIVVGGRIAGQLKLPAHERLMIGTSMAELAAFVKGLLHRN